MKMHFAPRCTAKSKRSGLPCKSPAVRGWAVCRMHGAGGGAKPGKAHPAWRHGLRGQEWIEARAKMNELMKEAREIERILRGGAT